MRRVISKVACRVDAHGWLLEQPQKGSSRMMGRVMKRALFALSHLALPFSSFTL
jgi:hypothetical protein